MTLIVLRLIGRVLRWIWRGIGYTILLFICLFGLQSSVYHLNTELGEISLIINDVQFDYVTWELNAIGTKIQQTLWGLHPFMEEEDRSQYVRDYMADLAEARQIEAQINAIYVDPSVDDPDAESSELRMIRDERRSDLRSRQSLMEAILEGQVASVLIDEGFGTLGQLLPPMAMHFTQVPNLLIVSPRNEIRFDVSINITPLPIDEIVAIEERVADELGLSALVVPLGGIALYPAMIAETTNIRWAVETFSHEWLHHYLYFFPLGLEYFSDSGFAGDTRAINETVADTFGKVIRDLVLARYYPELVVEAVNVDLSLVSSGISPLALFQDDPPEEQPFDFGAEMNETRIRVDHYMETIDHLEALAEGLRADERESTARVYDRLLEDVIVDVEAYMEERRAFFCENGVCIRKINQAYFAFYGGYQAGGIPGVAGEDPIGPAVQDILALSDDIHQFVVTMRGITTREELIAVRDSMLLAENGA